MDSLTHRMETNMKHPNEMVLCVLRYVEAWKNTSGAGLNLDYMPHPS